MDKLNKKEIIKLVRALLDQDEPFVISTESNSYYTDDDDFNNYDMVSSTLQQITEINGMPPLQKMAKDMGDQHD